MIHDRARFAPSLLLAATLLLPPRPAVAQEAHVFLLTGGSTASAFDEVSGMGVALAFRLADWMRLQATLDTRSTTLRRTGTACINPSVDWRCVTDGIDTKNSFSSVTAAFLPTWEPHDKVRLGAGVGAVIGTAGTESEPDSGRTAKVFHRKTAQLGGVGVLDVQLLPVEGWPLVLVGQYQGRRIDLEGCAPDDETYAPFCGTEWWHEVQVGVGVRF